MFDKVFKVCVIAVLILSLLALYELARKDRYQVVTEYEGSVGIFDTRKGVLYLLDYDSDRWTVIKPLEPVQPSI